EPHGPHRAPYGRDRHLALADPRRDRRRPPPDRRGLLRPHARPARAAREPRPRRERQRRPGHRIAPHRRGHRHRPRPGPRRRAGRPRRHHPLRARGGAHGRGTRQRGDRHLRARPLRLHRSRPAAGRHRRLRARAHRGVLPGGGGRRADDAPHPDRGRHQRPSHDRGVLQGVRPRAAPGGARRPRAGRRAVDEGDAHRM
ncbi:MAG: Imidazoleglycerol-phosphate dehydratase, partial [uncultured Solirubrobacteraceae bacterium]